MTKAHRPDMRVQRRKFRQSDSEVSFIYFFVSLCEFQILDRMAWMIDGRVVAGNVHWQG